MKSYNLDVITGMKEARDSIGELPEQLKKAAEAGRECAAETNAPKFIASMEALATAAENYSKSLQEVEEIFSGHITKYEKLQSIV